MNEPLIKPEAPAKPAPTQEQLYDDLKRIGQLEDQKQKIQSEIAERTDTLRAAMKHLDKSSLLYQMLSSALGKPAASKPAAKKAPAKKAAKKKPTKKRIIR